MPDRRKAPRKLAFLTAYADADPGDAAFCIVCNLSAAGARLKAPADVDLPDGFDLRVNGRKRIRRALVRWRSSDAVGVAFA